MNKHKKTPTLAGDGVLVDINLSRKNVMTNNSTAASNVIPFRFESKVVRTVLVGDQPWFVAKDVASVLQYRDAFNMNRILDEDEKGTQIVSTPGGAQSMQVIDESGLYSAILRSRKAEAKRFKKWVTSEVLPAIRKHGRYEESVGKMATLIGQTVGTDGFHMLGAVVKGKVSGLPQSAQRRAAAKIWSQTHAAFGVRTAADIPAEQLDSARNFIAAYVVMEGEYLERAESSSHKVSWTASRWLEESMPKIREQMIAFQVAGTMRVTADMLYGPSELVSPTLKAITELENQGHNLEACRLEILAMRHHLKESENTLKTVLLHAGRAQGKGIRFPMSKEEAA